MTRAEAKERFFRWVAVPALAAVLVLLAVLQYRWSGQVSTATRTRMQSNLETSLLAFRLDVTRELGAVAVETKAALDASPGMVNPSLINEQLSHWQQTATHPNLVQHIYVWEDPARQQPLRFDPGRDRAERVGWPAEFEALQQHLKQASLMLAHAGGPQSTQPGGRRRRFEGRPHFHRDGHMQHRGGPPMGFPFLAVDQSLPALIYPVHRRGPIDQPGSSPMTWVVIRLNKAVLQKELFPELAQKYFRGQSDLEYHVAVRDSGRGQDRVIYASDPGFGADNNVQMDAALNLFGPPFGSAGASRGLEFLFTVLPPSGNDRPGQPDDKRQQSPDRLPRLEIFPHSGEQSVWQVIAKHKSGSVEAAVSGLRRRNLMASFGVLIVLGVTMALILIASQRARRLAKLQMDFVAGVSHELRTPLAVISSAAENIADGIVGDKQQLVRYGNTIVRQTRRLTQLVEQVLQFAAIEQSSRKPGLGAVNLADVVEAALEGTAAAIAAAQFTVERQIEPGLPPVTAEFNGLVQSLQNLITNAVKYGGENRWLRIFARTGEAHGRAREVKLTVEDHGIGISKEEIKQVFEPFYRSPAVAESGIHGTGLGLPLTRKIVEAMGGRVTAESELGKGSSFTIHLPVAEARGLEQAQRAADRPAGAEPGFSA
ncbi:MAG TPA: HAMP domain-containing sensor histidine kinase [Candidatus Angelobacter sp.]|nr:HAMP domain-containing sensor histidine kinase [Candidatus Angelobacter sp.]